MFLQKTVLMSLFPAFSLALDSDSTGSTLQHHVDTEIQGETMHEGDWPHLEWMGSTREQDSSKRNAMKTPTLSSTNGGRLIRNLRSGEDKIGTVEFTFP